jgi:hypothetical protein
MGSMVLLAFVGREADRAAVGTHTVALKAPGLDDHACHMAGSEPRWCPELKVR